MGRELKRVPLDFAWPLETVWKGFVNPHYEECTACHGQGSTTARQRLEDLVRLLLLSGEDAKRGRCHPYFHADCLNTQGIVPSQELTALTTGLAGREPSFLGHDACDTWSATKKIIKAAGLSSVLWGMCLVCHGDGIAPEKKAAYEAWEPTDPPEGDGYQIWETVSEGSPIS